MGTVTGRCGKYTEQRKVKGVFCSVVCFVSYDTKLLPPGSLLTPLKKVLKVFIPSFFMLFFIKKRRQGECRSFSFSVIHPTSFAYILIIIHINTETTCSVPLFKLAHSGCTDFKYPL